jgi:hypothetical protein
MEVASPPPPSPQRRPLSVGGVINDALDLYGRHVATLLGAALVIFVVAGIVQGLLRETDSLILSTLGTIVSLIASTLFTGFVVSLVSDVRDGRRDFAVGELVRSSADAIPRLIVNGLLLGLGVFIGFLLLIVPGLYLLTIWSVTAPAIVVERRGAIEAFGRSHELVRGNGWTVFGAILVAFLILVGLAIVAAIIGAAIADLAGAITLSIVVNVIAAPFAALVSSVLFFELRGEEAALAPPPATATA